MGADVPFPKGRSAIATDPYLHVERERERLVEELRTFCRFESISSERSPELEDAAAWLRDRLAGLLDSVEIVPIPDRAPAVLGTLSGTGSSRLLLYSHYDVQPVAPLEAWTSAEVRDGAIFARGVCDDKADVMARIHALEAWRDTRGALPFGVVWLCEGNEEIGSPGLAKLLAERAADIRADACLWESYLRRSDGSPEIGFGCRGLLHVELTLQRLANDQHSAFAPVFRSAAGDLVRALDSLVDEYGRVAIDGFHDAVLPPSPEELAGIAALPAFDAEGVGLPGRSPLAVADERELLRRLVYEPTANITGIWAGHIGEGVKTIVPATAHARVDFRLVPDQQPDATAALLREHLDRHGFADVDIHVATAIPPSRGALVTPLGIAVTQAAQDTMGQPSCYPIIPGSGPMHIVAALGIPAVTPPGSTRLDSGMHAPDEHARISDYLDQVKFTIRTLELLAENGGIS